MDPWFIVAKAYSRVYGAVKDYLNVNIRGLGFLLRMTRRDHEIMVSGRRIYFSHRLAESYARLLHGKWNEQETHLILSRIMSDMDIVFLDVGANIGEMVIDVASNSACRKVIAFEPNIQAVDVIEMNVSMNLLSNCVVIKKALGDRQSSERMVFGSHAPSASLLSSGVAVNEGTIVMVSTLDDEVQSNDVGMGNVVLLIDVEGYELNVIKGGCRLVREHKPLIIFEYHKETKKVFGLDEMRSELGNDYVIYRLRKDSLLDSDVDNAWNCVAIPLGTEFEQVLRPQICAA